MPAFPGPAAFAAFVGVKFGGYILAATALKKAEPAITASSLRVAATRTGLGILFGPPITFAMIFALNHFANPNVDSSLLVLYPFLFSLRVFIWALVIFIFSKRFEVTDSKFWLYACSGALWSCLLDLPGFWLAIISPGQIPVC
jgi:hypothetical protein